MRSIVAASFLAAAFPPLNWWPMAMLGIAVYLRLIVDGIDRPSLEDMTKPLGRWSRTRRWLARRQIASDGGILWLGGAMLWLILLQGIRLAFWPLYAGWLALACYLAIYIVVWVGIVRVLVGRWRWPMALAAPLAWMSVELVRGYMVTGFSGCLLGHTLAQSPMWIQTASFLGPYAVSGVLVAGGVLLHSLWEIGRKAPKPSGQGGRWIRDGVISLFILALAGAYGRWELGRGRSIEQGQPILRVALIQENAPTIFEFDEKRAVRSWESYVEQTSRASRAAGEIDLIVWPESVFTRLEPVLEWDGGATLPPAFVAGGIEGRDEMEEVVEWHRNINDAKFQRLIQAFAAGKTGGISSDTPPFPHWLLGGDVRRVRGAKDERLNAALWVSPEGKLLDYYAKQHLVMFGEYIPIADWFPVLYRLIGMQPATAGERSKSFEVTERCRIAPSICFENVLPHLLQSYLAEVTARGEQADVMINVTNDGWFRGSSILDHHLANAIFAAVENRKPMLVAANTGISAWIDGTGVCRQRTERLVGDFILAEPRRDNRWGLWQQVGDWPMRLIAMLCFAAWLWPSELGWLVARPRSAAP